MITKYLMVGSKYVFIIYFKQNLVDYQSDSNKIIAKAMNSVEQEMRFYIPKNADYLFYFKEVTEV